MALFKEKESNKENDMTQVIKDYIFMSLLDKNYTGASFELKNYEDEKGNGYFLFIPRIPGSLQINDELSDKIAKAIAFVLYPKKTLVYEGMTIEKNPGSESLNNARALRFNYINGTPQRLQTSFKELAESRSNFQIMPNLKVNMNDIVNATISGISGSGKSVVLNTFIAKALSTTNKENIFLVDPKNADLRMIGDYLKIPGENVVVPNRKNGESSDEYLNNVCKLLDNIYNAIIERQENEAKRKNRIYIFLDELMALTAIASKKIADTFKSKLLACTLLARSANICFFLCSQRIDNTVIPVACRSQCNLNIVLTSSILTETETQFTLPGCSPSSVIIPRDDYNFGRGIIKIDDGKNPGFMPVLFPLIKEMTE